MITTVLAGKAMALWAKESYGEKSSSNLTLYALRLISIKFLLVISMLCKTEWSLELRT